MIDLHIHSEHSDGISSVEQILKTAETKKLSIISITDHFTVAAYEKLKKHNIRKIFSGRIITGAEVGFKNDDGVCSETNMLIDGVEAYYANQTPEATAALVEYCKRHKLLMSGGNDAHHADCIGRKNSVPKNAVDAWIDKVNTI